MKRRKYAYIVGAFTLFCVAIVLFVPFFRVEATPPDFQPYSTTTTVEGTQTKTFTLVATPPTYPSTASLSFCFWGFGALVQNGRYYPLTTSHLQVEGAVCPTPQ